MRSAVYYPRTEVHNPTLMKSALLLWDKLHTIVPFKGYKSDYDSNRPMAEAWELIGAAIVPNPSQQTRAHLAIETTLQSGIPRGVRLSETVDDPNDGYEIFPQKFSAQTWNLMRSSGLAGEQLAKGDYPFSQEGGLLVMAKLADACAGESFARVTDRLMAHGLIGSGEGTHDSENDVVPITLDLIDAASIRLEDLIDFRRRERMERGGHDYTRLRHSYADKVQEHTLRLASAKDAFERDEMHRQFRFEMESDLRDLRTELRGNRTDLLLKPVVVSTLVAAGSFAAHSLHTPGEFVADLGVTLAASIGMHETVERIGAALGAGISFSRRQKEVMSKHPMAYLYSLSSVRRVKQHPNLTPVGFEY